MFDVETMNCVTECTGDHFQTAYTLASNSSDIGICRPLTYYVNPDSDKIMELGTREYPFRDINLVLIEVNNEHQHTDRNITVYVMEATDSYLSLGDIKILNITKFSIDTYTELESSIAQSANFRTVDTISDLGTSKTLFNIVQNTKRNALDTSQMDEHEFTEFASSFLVVFLIHRSSFELNNINIYTESADISGIIYIYTSY